MHMHSRQELPSSLFKLFLRAKLRSVTALLLAAVLGTRWETGIALSANSLVAVEFLGQESQGRIVDPSAETKDQVKGGLLLDVVVRESAAVLELLSSKNQSLLIWRNSLFVLDLSLDILNGVGGLDVQGDGLTSQCFHKDLHGQRSKVVDQRNAVYKC